MYLSKLDGLFKPKKQNAFCWFLYPQAKICSTTFKICNGRRENKNLYIAIKKEPVKGALREGGVVLVIKEEVYVDIYIYICSIYRRSIYISVLLKKGRGN